MAKKSEREEKLERNHARQLHRFQQVIESGSLGAQGRGLMSAEQKADYLSDEPCAFPDPAPPGWYDELDALLREIGSIYGTVSSFKSSEEAIRWTLNLQAKARQLRAKLRKVRGQ